MCPLIFGQIEYSMMTKIFINIFSSYAMALMSINCGGRATATFFNHRLGGCWGVVGCWWQPHLVLNKMRKAQSSPFSPTNIYILPIPTPTTNVVALNSFNAPNCQSPKGILQKGNEDEDKMDPKIYTPLLLYYLYRNGWNIGQAPTQNINL